MGAALFAHANQRPREGLSRRGASGASQSAAERGRTTDGRPYGHGIFPLPLWERRASRKASRRMSNVVRFGLTPKMKPVSPRRSAVVAGLDIGTSKIVCMIARLEPQAPKDVLRRRSHGVRILGFAHTAASGMKAGGVVDL